MTGTVHIRAPRLEEFEAFAPMVARICADGPFGGMTVNYRKAALHVKHWLEDPNWHVQMAIVGDQPAGLIVGFIDSEWFSDDKLAADKVLYVADGYRALGIGKMLAEGFEKWAFAAGAKAVFLSHSLNGNMEAAEATYRKIGFRRVGPIYAKWKPHV